MASAYHDPALIEKVTAYANEHGPAAAAREFGLDGNLVKQWQYRARHRGEKKPRRKPAPKPSPEERKLKRAQLKVEAQEAAIGEVPVEPAEAVPAAPTAEGVAQECYRVALKAVAKIEGTIGLEPPRTVHGQWLHSLSGSLKILTTTAQLLSGEPTERTEGIHSGKVKHDIISKLTSDRALAERAIPVLTEVLGGPGGNGSQPGSQDN